ncbi:translation factor [Basidiobolus meristosporus CBS 931.73]|uniref:Threonylcarbamoyl-AMP synthase n=1 Tax=Basidiobolus meristosporus CBS 931.73 TaxID=1314790 RepID=A0A1Y1YJD8_9FUNG|nr:translation factor [Basidiobolus meristosporus CBS 931.73]|eukprot:ORX98141.1 translation factor [Basidiobolus meristosporus CBS 931.73]
MLRSSFQRHHCLFQKAVLGARFHTRCLSVGEQGTFAEGLEEAVRLLKEDQIVGIPTETVYGLGGNALSEKAVSKIFEAKNRPPDNPLIVHVSSLSMLKSILPNNDIPKLYLPLLNAFWPGPLTLLFPKSELIPDIVTCGQPTVAIRFPKHPITQALIEKFGKPVAAPSANTSGKPSPTLAEHVCRDLSGKIPLVLDGGACNVGVESTVLNGLTVPPVILRPGGITYEQIRAVPGFEDVRVYQRDFSDKEMEKKPPTPGMKYRHYAPDAPVILVECDEGVEDTLQKIASEIQNASAKVGVLRTSSFPLKHRGLPVVEYSLGDGNHPDQVARELFKGLRILDGSGVKFIIVEGIKEDHEGLAVMNRLRKAADKIVTSV